MDYSKLPLAKRTRLQEDLFFQQYNEEKKKKKAAEKHKAFGSSTGDRSSMDGDSGQSAAVEGAGSRSTANSVQYQENRANVGFQEGCGPVFDKDGENNGARSEEGNIGRVDGERLGESSGRVKERNKEDEVDSRRKEETEKVKRNKKGSETGGVDADDDVVFLRTQYSDVVELVSDSEEESEGSSDEEDYLVGSGDSLYVGLSSDSDFAEDDDEAAGVWNGKGKVGATTRRRRRGKSPEVVCLGQSGRDGDDVAAVCNGKRKEKVQRGSGSVDGSGEVQVGEVGFKRRREEESSPEVVFLRQEQQRVDGGEGFVVEEEEADGEDDETMRNRKLSSSLVEGGEEEEEEEEEDGSGELKRNKYCGPRTTSVAERLRSRPRRGEKKEKKELGSFSSPFTLADEEEEEFEIESSSSSGEDEEEEDNSLKSSSSGKVGTGNGNSAAPMSVDAKTVGKSHDKPKGKVERPAKRMKPILVGKILADSILQKSDVLAEVLVSSKVPDMESTLPLKFRFLDEVLITPEKSPWDAEADKLFAEMEFALAACAIGGSDSSMIDNEDSFAEETESDRATSCCPHHLIIDEEIGYKCIFCPFVAVEIKDLLPSFGKHPLGRSDKNYWNSHEAHVNFDKLQSQDSASTSNSKDHNSAEGTVWDLIPPDIKTSMFNHQQEGFEFIWKSIGGSIYIEELKKSGCDGGSGCIISHAPGTGKTRLAIVFLQAFMELNPVCMPVIVAPRGMLHTWEEEFKKWFDIPFHNLSRSGVTGREDKAALNLLNKAGGQGKNNVSLTRLVKLHSWTMGKSVLGISYRLFEKLSEDGIVSGNDKGGSKMKRRSKPYAEPEKVRKMLLEFPKLLVLDEGHTPRNDQSLMWRVLSGVQTQRRILLSGTPFQNNFDELFNTLSLVRPKFYDKIVNGSKGDSRRNRGREGRKGRGKWASLTNSIEKDAGNKLNELRAIIDPFVHVYKGEILEMLPGLKETIIVLKPTVLQKSLIEVIQGRRNVFKRDHLLSLISVHPSLLLGHELSDKERLSVDTDKLEKLRFDPKAGVKTNFLMELIRLSMAEKEKVLVFSQFIKPLTLIREQLKSSFGLTEGKDLLYMDGQIEARHRQSSISLLNDPDSQVQVLLASTRACSEGISLVGASRVVLLDVAWNPSKEKQAVSRAYRFGQKKFVYTYHLIMSGAMEVEKHAMQIQKDRLSELVFSSADGKLQGEESISCAVNDDKILEEMMQHEKTSSMFELVHTFG